MSDLLQLDIKKILSDRVPASKRKMIPDFALSALEKLIHQDELNAMLRYSYPHEGSEFSAKILEYLGIHVEVEGLSGLDRGGRYVFASNHPLGGLDGITLVEVLGRKFGDENVRFLVNDMLLNVTPLKKVFLPINKYGAQGRAAAVAINEAYASDKEIVIFPAGLVSRRLDSGKIQDLTWQKAFVTKAIEYDRKIVPVRFEALNRARFYNIARWRKKIGLRVNIEQILLPAELCASHGARFRIIFGKPITAGWMQEKIEAGQSPTAIAAAIRKIVYEL